MSDHAGLETDRCKQAHDWHGGQRQRVPRLGAAVGIEGLARRRRIGKRMLSEGAEAW